MSRENVSVIVPCFNEAGTIRLLLDAIDRQTYPRERIEVLIADGRSTDRTLEEIRSWTAAHPAQKIPVIFYIEFSNQKIANAIAEATGAVTREIHSGHNVSKADFDAGVTLYDLMKKNLSILKEALYN